MGGHELRQSSLHAGAQLVDGGQPAMPRILQALGCMPCLQHCSCDATQILSTSMTGGLQHVKYDSDRDLTACSDLSDSGNGAHRRNYKTAPKPSPMSSPIPGKGRQAVGGAANLVSEQTCSVHSGDAKAAIRQSREHRHQKGRRQHLIHHRPSQEQCLWQYCNNTSAARQV